MNTRLYGSICIVGSVLASLGSLIAAPSVSDGVTPSDYFGLQGVALMVWIVGSALAVVAMITHNVVGKGTISRFLAFVVVVGLALVFIGQTYHYLTGVDPNTNESPLISLGWLVYMVGVLLLAILTIAAGTWRGWKRFMPLVAFLTILITPVLGDLVGNIFYVSWLAQLPWIGIGYAVATMENTAGLESAVT
jgi:hypothetical protein